MTGPRGPVEPGGPVEPSGARHLVAVDDPEEERTWVFDLSFLLSNWRCIYGSGCQGVLTEPAEEEAHGCCSYGAHFVDDEDHEAVLPYIDALRADQWQFRAKGRREGATRRDRSGQWVTRVHHGACILLNRPGFPGGAGCALHRAALDDGARPLDRKPDVCWQLPLRLEESTDEHGYVTSTLRAWHRRDWGAGGADFHWWCTESEDAYDDHDAVYRTLRDEIVELIGAVAYRLLEDVIERGRDEPVAFPVRR